jgi:hypothetical protein
LNQQIKQTVIMSTIILNGSHVKETKSSILFRISDDVLGSDQIWISKKGIVSKKANSITVLAWTLTMQGRSTYGFQNA